MEAIIATKAALSVALRPSEDHNRKSPVESRSLEAGHDQREQPHDVADTPENRSRVDSAIRVLDAMQAEETSHNRFRYHVHMGTGKIQVNLVNYMTGEVIQEVPSSKMLEFSARMEQLTGLVLDKRG